MIKYIEIPNNDYFFSRSLTKLGFEKTADLKKEEKIDDRIFNNLDKLKEIKNSILVLATAVGSGEYWGRNKNSDYFFEKDLFPPEYVADYGYKTFVTIGNPFRHHCFLPGTKIIKQNRIRESIENINKEDYLVSSNGNTKILDIYKNEYDGEIFSIKIEGIPELTKTTPNHPFLCFKREQIFCEHNYGKFNKNTKHCCNNFLRPIGDPAWVFASDLKEGDFLCSKIPEKLTENSIESCFAELIGWVASEGYLSKKENKKWQIKFTFSNKNNNDIEALLFCLKNNNLNFQIFKTKYNCTQICVNSKTLWEKLNEYIIGTKNKKYLTNKVLELSKENLLYLLGAYISGDGHIVSKTKKENKRGDSRGTLIIRSSSKQMLYSLADILAILNVPNVINYDIKAGKMRSPTNKKIYNPNGSGYIAINNMFSSEVTLYSRKKANKISKNKLLYKIDNFFLKKITKIIKEEYKGLVYNFKTADKNYIANEVIVHNCNNDPKKTLGKVESSIFNPNMHRVELIIRVDKNKCDMWNHSDLFDKLMNNEKQGLSMGCKILFDICSICGNRAKNKKEYCEHIIKQLGQLLPNGKEVVMINPQPKFFDISFVNSPAWEPAHVIKLIDNNENLKQFHIGSALEFLDDKKEVKKTAMYYSNLLENNIIKTAQERKIDKTTEYQGIPIHIEFPAGTVRKGKNWSTLMKSHYGRVPGTIGNDGDAVDCYLSKEPRGDSIYVIKQLKDDGKFDEEKFMIGYCCLEDAKDEYLKHIPKNKFGAIATLSIDKFKERFGLKKEAEKKIALTKQIPMNIVSIGKNIKDLKK
jgi:inorganic pyrophosphatase